MSEQKIATEFVHAYLEHTYDLEVPAGVSAFLERHRTGIIELRNMLLETPVTLVDMNENVGIFTVCGMMEISSPKDYLAIPVTAILKVTGNTMKPVSLELVSRKRGRK